MILSSLSLKELLKKLFTETSTTRFTHDFPFIFRSDTESEDRGSADKSSVSKLTEEKQKKRFLPQTLDSIKRKNKDKPVDIEAVKSQAEKVNKEVNHFLDLMGTIR